MCLFPLPEPGLGRYLQATSHLLEQLGTAAGSSLPLKPEKAEQHLWQWDRAAVMLPVAPPPPTPGLTVPHRGRHKWDQTPIMCVRLCVAGRHSSSVLAQVITTPSGDTCAQAQTPGMSTIRQTDKQLTFSGEKNKSNQTSSNKNLGLVR